jgi:hypothetical protein
MRKVLCRRGKHHTVVHVASWPGLSRSSTSSLHAPDDVDDRAKLRHDGKTDRIIGRLGIADLPATSPADQ